MSDPGGLEKELVGLLKLSYPDLLKPSLKELGFGLRTIVEFLGLPLLRLQYINIKTKPRFEKRIEKLVANLNEIPVSDRAELHSSIAFPALDQLSIETDEDISDLYINLLTKTSSLSEGREAHPSFINALRNMCNDEAKLIEYFRDKIEIPFIIARLQFNETEGIDKTSILTAIENQMKLQFSNNIPLYFENLTGLGILSKELGSLSDKNRWYKPLFDLYEPLRIAIYDAGHSDGKKYKVVYHTSYYRVTSYGRMFIDACLKKYPSTETS